MLEKTLNRIYDLFHINNAKISTPTIAKNVNVSDRIVLSQYSDSELKKMLTSKFEKEFDTDKVLGNIMEHLKGVSSQRTTISKRLEDLKYLSPEIEQIKMIYVSSILSPTDMQTDAINISVNTGNTNLDTELSEFLNDYFNGDLHLGVKLKRWLERSLFEYGSSPVVVVPRSNIAALDAITDKEVSTENIKQANKFPDIGLEQLDEITKSKDSLIFSNKFKDDLKNDVSIDISFENLKVPEKEGDKFLNTLTECSLEFINKNKDNITFVSNPFYLKEVKTSKEKIKKSLKVWEEQLMGKGDNKVFSLSDIESGKSELDHPFVIELDPNLTVPVCVPGTNDEHIGYFVLTDSNGNLVTSETYQNDYMSAKGLQESSYQAMYGKTPGTIPYLNSLGFNNKNENTEAIFGLTVKKLLKEQLNVLNLGAGVTLREYDALSKCLFYNMLKNIKTKIIFIPSPMMIYYAYEFRSDGSGKSLLEDVEYLLSLRTTLIVATVLNGMKNAVDRKVIEVDVDEKNTDLERTLMTYKNIAVSKNIPSFNNNPYSASKGIIDQSISVLPKNIKGLSGSLNIDKSHVSSNIPQPEPEILERFTNMMITHMGIPPASINALGENEYSRSIATTNLHFSNIVRTRQRQSKKFNDKFVKNYVSYSNVLRRKIKDIIQNNINSEEVVKTDGSKSKGKKPTDKKALKLDIETIINSISVNLPTCNISTDKAKYQEIGELISLLDNVFESLYPEGLVPKDDQELRNTLTSVKLYMKSENLKKVLTNIGYHKTFEFPPLSSIDEDVFVDIASYLNNLSKGMNDRLKVLKGSNDNDSGSNW